MTPTEVKKKKTKGATPSKTAGATPGARAEVICPACRTANPSNSRFCASCAAPLKGPGTEAASNGSKTVRASTVEMARGNRLAGRYEIIEELGQGGMGKVFKVYDHKISEVIALKLIRPEIGVQEKAIERFKNELKFTRKIAHRNICRMYDLGETDFVYYITMEYVAGEDLKRFVKRAGVLHAGKAISIARQVCEGLAEAHRDGAVHRDLKPQNIMIDQEGNAKIMDFGIARFTDMDRMTGSGVMIGTPEYMSPEQAELKEVDARADLYALGVVLFEMVTGKMPFEGNTPLSLAMKHKTEKPRNVRELNPQISVGLAAVIAKCLEKDRDKRYATADELKTALESVDKDLATVERVILPKNMKTKAVKEKAPQEMTPGTADSRKKIIVIAAAAVVFVAVALILFVPKSGPKTNNEPSVPPASVETKIPPAESKPDVKPVMKPEEPAPKTVSGDTAKPAPDVKTEAFKPGDSNVKPEGAKSDPAKTEAVKPPDSAKLEAPATGTKVQGPTFSDASAMDLAKARMIGAKSLAAKKGLDGKSLVFRTAEAREQEAGRAAAQKKISDSRCLYTVAEKLYRICADESDDPARLKALSKYAAGLQDSAQAVLKDLPADSLFSPAKERLAKGDAARDKNDLNAAVKDYVQSAVDFEKIKWAAQTAKKK
jgi:serine/threonine protein kinase